MKKLFDYPGTITISISILWYLLMSFMTNETNFSHWEVWHKIITSSVIVVAVIIDLNNNISKLKSL